MPSYLGIDIKGRPNCYVAVRTAFDVVGRALLWINLSAY